MQTIKTSGLLAGSGTERRTSTDRYDPASLAHIIICSQAPSLQLPWQINLFFYQFCRWSPVACVVWGSQCRRRQDSLKVDVGCLAKQIGRRRTWPPMGDISAIRLLRVRAFASLRRRQRARRALTVSFRRLPMYDEYTKPCRLTSNVSAAVRYINYSNQCSRRVPHRALSRRYFAGGGAPGVCGRRRRRADCLWSAAAAPLKTRRRRRFAASRGKKC